MNPSLLVLALLFFAAPGYSMTATVTSTTPPTPAPSAPGAAASSATSGTTKPVAPNATSVTKPSTALAAPGIPTKSNAAPAKAGAARAPILPSVAPQNVSSPPNSAAWAATTTSDNSAGMRKGTLQAFNASAGTFQVYGQKLTFNPQKVKVFNAGGKPASVYSLKNGSDVRFTLDTTDLKHRRVAVIYIN